LSWIEWEDIEKLKVVELHATFNLSYLYIIVPAINCFSSNGAEGGGTLKAIDDADPEVTITIIIIILFWSYVSEDFIDIRF
jgi:hypothetical protein